MSTLVSSNPIPLPVEKPPKASVFNFKLKTLGWPTRSCLIQPTFPDASPPCLPLLSDLWAKNLFRPGWLPFKILILPTSVPGGEAQQPFSVWISPTSHSHFLQEALLNTPHQVGSPAITLMPQLSFLALTELGYVS